MLRIAFTGDVSFHDKRGRPGPGGRWFAPAIVEALSGCDHVVFNIEGPITEAPPQKERGAIVQSRPAFLPILEQLHCSIFNLANNHIFDHGLEGYRDTIAAARSRGWQWLGAGENLEQASAPLILKSGDTSVGLISVCHEEGPAAGPGSYGVFWHTQSRLILRRIRTLKEQGCRVGITYHGGEEIYRYPIPSRHRRLLTYIKAGADFVVAHHAHVVQGYQVIDGKHVFFGLGDFAFDAWPVVPPDPAVNESVLLVLRIPKEGPVTFVPVFTYHDRNEGRVRTEPVNPWFQEVPNGSYRAAYAGYARDVFREWMTIANNPRPSRLRRLRRLLGLTRTLGNFERRPLFLAAVRHAVFENFRWDGRYARTIAAGGDKAGAR